MRAELMEPIIEKGVFPTIVNNKIGEEIKKELGTSEPLSYELKEARKRYVFDYHNERYILIEEFLFDEKDSLLEYKHIIGKNFFLTKKPK